MTDVDQVSAIAGGYSNSLAMRSDGTVWMRGYNHSGQVGDGTLVFRPGYSGVVNESFSGFLDLSPGTPKLPVAADKQPRFFLSTVKSGERTATSLYADIRGSTPLAPLTQQFPAARGNSTPAANTGYQVFVAARGPAESQTGFFQLDSRNQWSPLLTWPMSEYLRNVALESNDSIVRVNILQSTDLSTLGGASILVGYGLSADEMLSAGRFRVIFTVPGP
jgi:hypothetical protein